MLSFASSLTFLYAFAITVLVAYGISFYRLFSSKGNYKKTFPYVFAAIGLACLGFLFINFRAPLSLKSYSNLDHHFLRHCGFTIKDSVVLGRSDTTATPGNHYNSYSLERKKDSMVVSADYSEDPLFAWSGRKKILLSQSFSAGEGQLSFVCETVQWNLSLTNTGNLELRSGEKKYVKPVKRNAYISAWDMFKDDTGFIDHASYADKSLNESLRQIHLFTFETNLAGPLYFISGKIFRYSNHVVYNDKPLNLQSLCFRKAIPFYSKIGWGSPGKNQFLLLPRGATDFVLQLTSPVTYPLTEEKPVEGKEDWSLHTVNKFLVSKTSDLGEIPGVFNEGFLFSQFQDDSAFHFTPVLFSYQKQEGGKELNPVARRLNDLSVLNSFNKGEVLLPAADNRINWIFNIDNSFNWNFSGKATWLTRWQVLIFSALLFYMVLIICTSLIQQGSKANWIWQISSCIFLVLLTTRFFLYWRYKSFPPYDSLDLPAMQQLNSPWNFAVILIVTILLAVILGFGSLRYCWKKFSGLPFLKLEKKKDFSLSGRLIQAIYKFPKNHISGKFYFLLAWGVILLSAILIAALNDFSADVSRHLAIGLTALYFLFLFVSYRHSPLVVPVNKAWWKIRTQKKSDILVSNPVKILLSVSLLGLFAFLDMGFAIVFFNYLLFNEAFLFVNYAAGGLSAGSRSNAFLFGKIAAAWLALFIINLLFAPVIFSKLLELPELYYLAGYVLFGVAISLTLLRIIEVKRKSSRVLFIVFCVAGIFLSAFFLFPKEKILDKAALTRYRIDVMAMPVNKVIEKAYRDGRTYEPVIRAAQNQWFINSFIDRDNNPKVFEPAFHLLPHAPQNKGARYNAQATDLVTSRFLIAEHGKWAVLLFVLILIVPAALLASFCRLYPDFTNRLNDSYPAANAGFSILNYVLVTALLVILAATGRYIFFGQDLPFGSILSKQSILFPAALMLVVVLLFKNFSLERYHNRYKFIPGLALFTIVGFILLLARPAYNRDKVFTVDNLAAGLQMKVENFQDILDEIESNPSTERLPLLQKDRLFVKRIKEQIGSGQVNMNDDLFSSQLNDYLNSGYYRHVDDSRLLFLDIHSGRPRLAVNANYFRVDPPPHLQQSWKGNVYGGGYEVNITAWNNTENKLVSESLSKLGEVIRAFNWNLVMNSEEDADRIVLYNRTGKKQFINYNGKGISLNDSDSLFVEKASIIRTGDVLMQLSPGLFMRNFQVNGSRFYWYPRGNEFIWARNFAEAVSSASNDLTRKDVFVSLDAALTDSLSRIIKEYLNADTAYKDGAEYAISVSDGDGRLIAIPDFIKGFERPDPNNKPAFLKATRGDNGFVPPSLLRKQLGNINLLRMMPGPGSTLKPVVFASIASQLAMDWDLFAAEGFSEKLQYFGGEKVNEYDFEKNNGRIGNVVDYLKYSDNYYHSNLLLLGSYSKQNVQQLLSDHFSRSFPAGSQQNIHWPWFTYKGKEYWLDGFKNWPGFANGKADFGSDSSFLSIGLYNNFGIYPWRKQGSTELFGHNYDSSLFNRSSALTGFVLPEYPLFDQKGTGMDMRKPKEVFISSFRGHVKGSSQVMIPPVKMVEAFGKLVTQNRSFSLTFNPGKKDSSFRPFYVDPSVNFTNYLSLTRQSIFKGMQEALYHGTAARLGAMIKDLSPWYFYAKTGTTGEEDSKAKSKLFALVISEKDITDPIFNFRDNRFYILYFTSQKGPAKQNEDLQAALIKCVLRSSAFNRYMKSQVPRKDFIKETQIASRQ